jgi:hypothetical protein
MKVKFDVFKMMSMIILEAQLILWTSMFMIEKRLLNPLLRSATYLMDTRNTLKNIFIKNP